MSKVYYYENDPLKTHESMARYAFVRPQLDKEAVVLDLGCGARRGPAYLAEAVSEVVGVDVSEEASAFCRKQWPAPRVRYVVGNATALPFEDRYFDVVVSFEVLEHVRDQALFLKEIRRVLKQGGVCILSTPNRLVMSPEGIFANPDHVREFSAAELKEFLAGTFSRVALYGQKPSRKVEDVLLSRRQSYQEVSRVPVFLRHALPSFLRRRLFDFYVRFFAKKNRRAAQEEVGENDFPIKDDGIEDAHYLIAVVQG
jgi:ubiquinone/menaquinone biosynthesis C-methylase UbiE